MESKKIPDAKGKSPEKDHPEYGKERKASFVYEPNNNRKSDANKIQRRMSEQYLYPYKFVVCADTQITSEREKYWKQCVAQVNKIKPKFMVIVGDICDSPPTTNHEYALRRQQEREFFTILDGLDDSVYFMPAPGEHDVGIQPTHNTINRYRLSFGQEFFDFTVAGMKFIVLNSQYYVSPSAVESYVEEQEKWLDEKLNDGNNGPLGPIVFMHTPPFTKSVDEVDSPACLNKAKRKQILDKFERAGVKYIFCGHLHANSTVNYSKIQIITTSSVGDPRGADKRGFRVVTLYENKLTHEFVTLEDLPVSPVLTVQKSPTKQ